MAAQEFSSDEFSLDDERLVKELVRFSPAVLNRRRLAILFELYSTPAVDFSQLKHDTGLKDGILATHLRTLTLTRLIEVRKEIGSRNKTRYAITERGRQKLLDFFALIRTLNQSIVNRDLR